MALIPNRQLWLNVYKARPTFQHKNKAKRGQCVQLTKTTAHSTRLECVALFSFNVYINLFDFVCSSLLYTPYHLDHCIIISAWLPFPQRDAVTKHFGCRDSAAPGDARTRSVVRKEGSPWWRSLTSRWKKPFNPSSHSSTLSIRALDRRLRLPTLREPTFRIAS